MGFFYVFPSKSPARQKQFKMAQKNHLQKLLLRSLRVAT